MPKRGGVIRGDEIGRRANDWFVWYVCPVCAKGRWILRWKVKVMNFTGLCWACSARRNVKRGIGSRPNENKECLIKTTTKTLLTRQGNKNANWKGGLTELVKGIRRSPEYYQWRKAVLERDNHTCQDCGKIETIDAHHIRAIIDYPEGIFEIENGLAVCGDCHNRHTFWQKLLRRKRAAQGMGDIRWSIPLKQK